MIRRLLTAAALAAGLALTGAAVAQTAAPAAVASFRPSRDPVDDVERANAALQAWVEQRTAAGAALPRLSDPQAAALLRAAFDERALASPRMDLEVAPRLCLASAKTVLAYMLSGTSGRSASEAEVIVGRNMQTYQDEMIPGLSFGVSCSAASLRLVNDMLPALQANPNAQVLQGVEMMRRGVYDTYAGGIDVQASTALSATNRARLRETLVRHAPLMIEALQGEARRRLLFQIDGELARTDAAGREALLALRAEAAKESCVKLCALGAARA